MTSFRFIRHGEKSAEGGLTENGAQASKEVGSKITIPIIGAYSSPVSRVRDTIGNVLEGASQSKRIKSRKWLGLDIFSEAFSKEWFARQAEKKAAGIDAEKAQDQTAQEFLDNMFISEKPLSIAKPFFKKVLSLMKRRNVDRDDTMLILGTHQTTTESIIYSLLPEIPEEWKAPLGYSEYADFSIVRRGTSPVLKVTLRGVSKEISQASIQNIVQEKS